jgi:hypothetical protein
MELWEWHPDVDGWRDSEGGRQERFWAGVCRDTLFVLGWDVWHIMFCLVFGCGDGDHSTS